MIETEEVVWTPADVQREEDRELARIEQMTIERAKHYGYKTRDEERNENKETFLFIKNFIENHWSYKLNKKAIKAVDAVPSRN